MMMLLTIVVKNNYSVLKKNSQKTKQVSLTNDEVIDNSGKKQSFSAK